jgi:hypothetical protein
MFFQHINNVDYFSGELIGGTRFTHDVGSAQEFCLWKGQVV